jgi:hypothetical protein
VFILKGLKVIYFHTLLQVFILHGLRPLSLELFLRLTPELRLRSDLLIRRSAIGVDEHKDEQNLQSWTGSLGNESWIFGEVSRGRGMELY